MFRRYNPWYISCRLLRKFMPEPLAHRLLSRRQISVEELYRDEFNSTWTYLKAFENFPELKNLFHMDTGPLILEAGTGIYNPASAPFLLSGTEQLILLEPYIGKAIDEDRFRKRVNSLLKLAGNDPDFPLPKTEATPDLFERIRHCDRLWEDTGLAEQSVDLILSTSVLEHLRRPEKVIEECARIIKKGGWMINVIDLRDHFFKYPFEMLKYSQKQWRLVTTVRGGAGYQNRWRLSHWTGALAGAGFETTVMPVLTLPERLRADKQYFHRDFRNLSNEDLEVARAVLISHKVDF